MNIQKKNVLLNLSNYYNALWTIPKIIIVVVVGSSDSGRRRVFQISTTSHSDPRISGLKKLKINL